MPSFYCLIKLVSNSRFGWFCKSNLPHKIGVGIYKVCTISLKGIKTIPEKYQVCELRGSIKQKNI